MKIAFIVALAIVLSEAASIWGHEGQLITELDHKKLIRETILQFYQGHRKRDIGQILDCLGPTFYKVSAFESDDPTKWKMSDLLKNPEEMRKWFEQYLDNITNFENKVEILNLYHNTFSAIVVTRESGTRSTRDRKIAWNRVINVYSLALIGREWKIVSILLGKKSTLLWALF